MKRKHQPYRRNDGFWSCGVCKWQWDTRPSRDDCPGILRIAHSTEQYKTAAQWRKLGFEPVDIGDADATSHGHSSKWHYYYHRDHVRGLTKRAVDSGDSPASEPVSSDGGAYCEHGDKAIIDKNTALCVWCGKPPRLPEWFRDELSQLPRSH